MKIRVSRINSIRRKSKIVNQNRGRGRKVMHLPCKQVKAGALPAVLHHPSLGTGVPRRFQAKDVLRRLGEGGLFTKLVPSYGWQAMFYTYVIESLSHVNQQYTGHTADLRQRLADHNARKCPHTSKFVPWKIKLYVAFETLEQAQRFERYLKSGSGHVFAKRHFWIKEVTSNPTAGNSTKAQR